MNLSRQEMVDSLSEISPCFLEDIEDIPGSFSFSYAFSEGIDEDSADYVLIKGPYSLSEEDINFVLSHPKNSDWDEQEANPEVPWTVAQQFVAKKIDKRENFYILKNSGYGNDFEIYDRLESATEELLSRTLENSSHINLVTWNEMEDEELLNHYKLLIENN